MISRELPVAVACTNTFVPDAIVQQCRRLNVVIKIPVDISQQSQEVKIAITQQHTYIIEVPQGHDNQPKFLHVTHSYSYPRHQSATRAALHKYL
jgi:hypothetical protein